MHDSPLFLFLFFFFFFSKAFLSSWLFSYEKRTYFHGSKLITNPPCWQYKEGSQILFFIVWERLASLSVRAHSCVIPHLFDRSWQRWFPRKHKNLMSFCRPAWRGQRSERWRGGNWWGGWPCFTSWHPSAKRLDQNVCLTTHKSFYLSRYTLRCLMNDWLLDWFTRLGICINW